MKSESIYIGHRMYADKKRKTAIVAGQLEYLKRALDNFSDVRYSASSTRDEVEFAFSALKRAVNYFMRDPNEFNCGACGVSGIDDHYVDRVIDVVEHLFVAYTGTHRGDYY